MPDRILSAPGGVRKGPAFILAWLTCLVVVIAGVLLFTGGRPSAPRTPSSTAALVAKLTAAACRRRTHVARGGTARPPRASRARARVRSASPPRGTR